MPPDPPHILLKKAREDEYLALLVVNDASDSDEQDGFFCQQAVEKAIKAVLSRRGVKYRRTHDLAELLDLVKDAGIACPADLNLTPFAAELRYDYLPPEVSAEQPFARARAVRLVRVAIDCADLFMQG